MSLFCLANFLQAQNVNPDIVNRVWKAYWISPSEEMNTDYGVYRFTKDINLSEKPSTYVVHVSADNRYKLLVNGKLTSLGPASGDVNHWNYETVDLAPYLSQGENSIDAIVWNDGRWRPIMQISMQTAFILQGDTKREYEINTNNSWKYSKITAYKPIEQKVNGYYALGPGEFVDMNLLTSSSKEDDWHEVQTIGIGKPKGSNTLLPSGEWMLVPSSLPPMEMTLQRLSKTRHVEGVAVPSSFPATKSDITIPANTSATLLLDQTYLTNAYPTLIYSKGKDASVSIGYAESLYGENLVKGNRNDIDGKSFVGRHDSIICNGLDNQNYTPLSWRTYRYVQLKIETKEEPLVINDIYGTFTGYPFKNNATIESDVPVLNDILQIGWRTARLCAVETYFDCPYYEQLQYLGDTRIQAMVSYYNSGDDRLARNAINLGDYSRMPEGITQSRYPSSQNQIIPPYSLFWIGMVYDYYRYRPDSDFVRSKLRGVRQILAFFSDYQQADGSLKDSPYWNFTDWAEGSPRAWKFGTPPLGSDGSSSVLDLQLLWALQVAAELENSIGDKVLAQRYVDQVSLLKKTIYSKYWDSNKGLFADNIEKNVFSEHANALAILTEMVIGEDANKMYLRIKNTPDLIKTSIYFQYYLNEAMTKAGCGNDYLKQLDIWKKNIELGLTTWGEDSNVAGTRSDCHAWGSSPNIEFYRTVLGIDSDGAGFSKVRIEPHLGELTKISGSIPHWDGNISVSYILNKNKWNITISLPDKLDGVFIWKGEKRSLSPGENKFTIND